MFVDNKTDSADEHAKIQSGRSLITKGRCKNGREYNDKSQAFRILLPYGQNCAMRKAQKAQFHGQNSSRAHPES